MDLDDAEMSVKFVLHDRDASFTAASGAVFRAAGVRVVRSAIQARANAIAERRIAGARRECPDRMLITGERHPRLVLDEHTGHCNTRRRTGRCSKGRPPGTRIHPLRADASGSCAGTGSVA
jgi:putative transposase